MNKQTIIDYLNGKHNEDEVISLLKEQRKALASPKDTILDLNEEYFPIVLKLIRNSPNKVKYHAIILVSNIGFCMKAKLFQEICKIALENIKDTDGNIRHACFILIKNLNALMKVLPIINSIKKTSDKDINIFYESFKGLFYGLCHLIDDEKDEAIIKSILKSINIMLPKIYDMAEFWNDKDEMSMVIRIKDEISKVL